MKNLKCSTKSLDLSSQDALLLIPTFNTNTDLEEFLYGPRSWHCRNLTQVIVAVSCNLFHGEIGFYFDIPPVGSTGGRIYGAYSTLTEEFKVFKSESGAKKFIRSVLSDC